MVHWLADGCIVSSEKVLHWGCFVWIFHDFALAV